MGHATSRESPSGFLPPVQTREELQERFKSRLANFYLSNTQQEWLRTIFHIFCTESDGHKFWIVDDLAKFIIATFVPNLEQWVTEAAPLLHRCLLRLGSFPYHNDAGTVLSLDVLQTGMIILLRLDSDKLLGRENSNPVALVYPNGLSAAHRVLLFQCMRQQQETSLSEARTIENDFHLQTALDLVTYGNFQRNSHFPTAVTRGPEYPPASHFPSSSSSSMSGTIPVDEFRPLLRLMFITQLYVAGVEPYQFATIWPQVETSTDSLLAAFIQAADAKSGVTFATFDKCLEQSMQNLFLGLPRVLGPLRSVKPFPSDSVPVFVPEAQRILKELFTPTVQTQPPPAGLIVNLPLLSQLSIALPQDFPIEKPQSLYSSTEIDVHQMKMGLETATVARMLLVKGKAEEDTLTFGIYLPKQGSPDPQTAFSALVQLSPCHRVFRQAAEDTKVLFQDNLQIQISFEQASLILDARSKLGTFAVKGIDTQLTFEVDAVEVLHFQGDFVRVDTFE